MYPRLTQRGAICNVASLSVELYSIQYVPLPHSAWSYIYRRLTQRGTTSTVASLSVEPQRSLTQFGATYTIQIHSAWSYMNRSLTQGGATCTLDSLSVELHICNVASLSVELYSMYRSLERGATCTVYYQASFSMIRIVRNRRVKFFSFHLLLSFFPTVYTTLIVMFGPRS